MIGSLKTIAKQPTMFIIPPVRQAPELSYTDFVKEVQKHEIHHVVIDELQSKAYIQDTNETVRIPVKPDASLLKTLIENDVQVQYYNNDVSRSSQMWMDSVLAGIMIMSVLYVIFARIGAGPQLGKTIVKENSKPDTRFSDIAGLEDAKKDLQEIIDFLKNPKKYNSLGAKIPKGCLLVSQPGCGKTHISRAVAGEAGVPFFSCSGSDFVELFVGNGARKVRELFAQAKKEAPCIVFIDEIDAVGKKRGASLIAGNDEREQTVNQLLVEMDGFDTDTNIVVMAATNRADILDPALLRPGRFDRHIHIELPDVRGRYEILKIHTKDKPLDKNLSLETIAKITAGFSGADLANLANEAAILTARKGETAITHDYFEKALEKIIMGNEKTVLVSEDKKRIVAYHEGGHTIAAYVLSLSSDYDKIRKVTIVPRGKAGGMTVFEPSEDRVDGGLLSREYLENQLVVALGGRVAEELVFGKERVTTGASGDIDSVYKLAKHMVTHYGLSEALGPIAWREDVQHSQTTAAQIDQEIKSVVSKAYDRCRSILTEHLAGLHALSAALLEKETLNFEEVSIIIGNYNVQN